MRIGAAGRLVRHGLGACIALLALISGLALGTDEGGRFRGQVRVGRLMAMIAAIAAVIALWPKLISVMRWTYLSKALYFD